jgi:hypothetical protein
MTKHPKTPEARRLEARNLEASLNVAGLPPEVVDKIARALRTFADEGLGFSEAIRHPDMPCVVACTFSTQAHVMSSIHIRHPPPVRPSGRR